MINYILVITATVLFSLQFLFNQVYEKENGNDLRATLTFTFYKSIAVALIMLVIAGFRIEFTLFSLFMAVLYALMELAMAYFSLKAFAVTNLSVYSVFTMLGGMLLPFLLGIFAYGESGSVSKVICCVCIGFAVVLNVKRGRENKKALLYYMAVFVLNGLAGVLSKIHQSSSLPHTDSESFMMIASLVAVLISGAMLLFTQRSIPRISGKSVLFVSGYGLFNGVGNLFLLLALIHLPASVQYPLVTGGVMCCTAIISTVRREKLTLREYAATAIALVASVLICF